MFQIDDPSAASARPPRPAAGTPGWFAGGDPATGRLGTRVRFHWLNTIQAELMAILAAAGLGPDPNDDGQVLRALRRLGVPQIVAFYASTSWTVPANVHGVRATVVGAGGAGGGTSATNGSQVSVGPGGNAGTVGFGTYPVTPGETIAITIGTGGAWNNGVGYAGGTTSFGNRLSAPGGQGAGGNVPANPPPLTQGAVAPGGISVGGNVNLFERQGSAAVAQNVVNFLSGRGADGPFGTGAAPIASSTAAGAQGLGFGAGGSGGASGPNSGPSAGGFGTNGLVIVEY